MNSIGDVKRVSDGRVHVGLDRRIKRIVVFGVEIEASGSLIGYRSADEGRNIIPAELTVSTSGNSTGVYSHCISSVFNPITMPCKGGGEQISGIR